MTTGRRTPSTSSAETVAPHWYRDLSIRARIFGLTAVLLLGLVVSTATGLVNGNRASDLHAESLAAVAVQQDVEAARYNLLWAANWQNITAWRARVDGGAVAAAPDGDNVAFYQDGAAGFEKLFAIDRTMLDAKAQASLDTIQQNWTVMSDYNDQIFQLWAAGRLDEGDAMSTGEKWDVFYVLDQAMTELVKSVDARAVSAQQQAEDADAFTQTVAGIVTALAVLLGLLVDCVVSRGIVRVIQGVRGGLERLAGGDLAVRLQVRGRDEVGQMAVALNAAAGTMAATVGEIAASADAVAASAEELSASSAQISASAQETSAQAGVVSGAAEEVSRSVETVAAGAEQMGASIREIASNAAEASEVAGRAVIAAETTTATVAFVDRATPTACAATDAALLAFAAISRIDADISSVPVATVWTLRETCSAAADTRPACDDDSEADPLIWPDTADSSSDAVANDCAFWSI
jgi:methyl-accepting chemotaxis protein